MGFLNSLFRRGRRKPETDISKGAPSKGTVHISTSLEADRKKTCSVCGHKFSDERISGNAMFLDVVAQKGFTCLSCGLRYCHDCIPKDSDGTLRCKCGNTRLTIDN